MMFFSTSPNCDIEVPPIFSTVIMGRIRARRVEEGRHHKPGVPGPRSKPLGRPARRRRCQGRGWRVKGPCAGPPRLRGAESSRAAGAGRRPRARGGAPRCVRAVRRARGARADDARDRTRRAGRDRGPERRREVDAAPAPQHVARADSRRGRGAGSLHIAAVRPRAAHAEGAHRHGLPAALDGSARDRDAERRRRAARADVAAAGARRARLAARGRAGRRRARARRDRGQAPRAVRQALRRRAAAGRRCAGALPGAGPHRRGRAARVGGPGPRRGDRGPPRRRVRWARRGGRVRQGRHGGDARRSRAALRGERRRARDLPADAPRPRSRGAHRRGSDLRLDDAGRAPPAAGAPRVRRRVPRSPREARREGLRGGGGGPRRGPRRRRLPRRPDAAPAPPLRGLRRGRDRARRLARARRAPERAARAGGGGAAPARRAGGGLRHAARRRGALRERGRAARPARGRRRGRLARRDPERGRGRRRRRVRLARGDPGRARGGARPGAGGRRRPDPTPVLRRVAHRPGAGRRGAPVRRDRPGAGARVRPRRPPLPALLRGPGLVLLAAVAVSWRLAGGDLAALLAPAARAALAGLLRGFFPPAHGREFLFSLARPLLETVAIAVVGLALALVLALPLALLATDPRALASAGRRPSLVRRAAWVAARALLDLMRSVPEVIWALILVRAVGLGPASGVAAIGIGYGGVLGKVLAEIFESTAAEPAAALAAAGATPLGAFAFGTLPAAFPVATSYVLYRFDCALRASAVLGLVGAGGIGVQLELSLKMLAYDEVATIVIALFALVAAVDGLSALGRRWLREGRGPLPTGRAGLWARAGALAAIAAVVAGASAFLDLPLAELFSAAPFRSLAAFFAGALPPDLEPAFLRRVLPAAVETLAVSVVGTALAAVLGLALAWAAARDCAETPDGAGRTRRALGAAAAWGARGVLNLLRTLPELLWALLLVLAVGLGPFAGALAAAGAGRAAASLFAALPHAFPQLVAYTLYRWEVNIRASAVLGVVGAGGLGTLLHLSLGLFHVHRTLTLVLVVVALVTAVDLASGALRRRIVEGSASAAGASSPPPGPSAATASAW